MTPSCRGVEFSFAAFNINRRYLCVTALKYCAEMSWSFTAVSLAGVRKSDAARGKSRWDASVSTLTELELKSLNRHHRGLFQCLLETRQGWWYGSIPKQAFHELYQNIAWLFGLTQTKPLLCVHVCLKNPEGKLIKWFSYRWHTRSTVCLKASGRWWDSPTIRLTCPRILLLILILSYGLLNAPTCFFNCKQQ